MDEIICRINGSEDTLEAKPGESLREALRRDRDSRGTKDACEVGKCGACTVLVDNEPIKSCLVPAHQATDKVVRTVEGIADLNGEDGLHPVQEAFIEEFGLQCGYCTPGFIVATVALLRENPDPTDEEIRDYLKGNLCRCTGYTKIFEAVRTAAERVE